MNDQKLIHEIRNLGQQLKEILPVPVCESSISSITKIPFKVAILKGILAHRISELGDTALELFTNSKRLQAIVLIRAVQETAAVLYWLSQRVLEVCDNKNVEGFDSFVMKHLFGSKTEPSKEEAFNILTAIDKVDKQLDGFRRSYELLCEFTHPNSAGTFIAFGKLDKKNGVFYFGSSSRDKAIANGLNALHGTLLITLVSLERIEATFSKFVQICERPISTNPESGNAGR